MIRAMQKTWLKTGGAALWFFCLFILFLYIPWQGTSVFLSPDETAVAVSARRFATEGDMKIPDPLLTDGPWIHPRSFVTQGAFLVPVGFLGMPMLAGLVWRIVGEAGLALFTPLLVASVIFPVWRLTQRFGWMGQITAVSVWMSFPLVQLYANRGLFPNLPVVCFAVWACYLLFEKPASRYALFVAGVCAGCALSIRPLEIVWIAPWLLYAWCQSKVRPRWRQDGYILLGLLLPIFVYLLIADRTYGSPFTVGYWLADPPLSIDLFEYMPVQDLSAGIQERSPGIATTVVERFDLQRLLDLWPFGFHPRNVWFNFRSYVLGFLAPWSALALFACAIHVRRRASWGTLGIGWWTVGALAMIYGQGIYQDHVGINVISTGNSYLRYFLPLAPLSAVAAAVCVDWLSRRLSVRKARVLFVFLVMLLAGFGIWTAFARDDEGILTSSAELTRYQRIRHLTLEKAGPHPIILSERSDKIFFPTFRVASPLPELWIVQALVEQAPVPVLLFSSVLDEAHLQKWKDFHMGLRPVFQIERQALYEIVPLRAISEI